MILLLLHLKLMWIMTMRGNGNTLFRKGQNCSNSICELLFGKSISCFNFLVFAFTRLLSSKENRFFHRSNHLFIEIISLAPILFKVHIFWEGHKNFAKSSPYFWLALHRTKVRRRFCKILRPSQNIWTLSLDLIFHNNFW